MNVVLYPFFSPHHSRELKVAALYFDKVYLLSSITVVDKDQLPRYDGLAEQLANQFGDLATLVPSAKARLVDRWLNTSLQLHLETASILKAGVLEPVNPFDEVSSTGLEIFFKEILAARARQVKENLKSHPYEKRKIIRAAAFACVPKPNDHDDALNGILCFQLPEYVNCGRSLSGTGFSIEPGMDGLVPFSDRGQTTQDLLTLALSCDISDSCGFDRNDTNTAACHSDYIQIHGLPWRVYGI